MVGLGVVTDEDILEAIAGRTIIDEDDAHARPRDLAIQHINAEHDDATNPSPGQPSDVDVEET